MFQPPSLQTIGPLFLSAPYSTLWDQIGLVSFSAILLDTDNLLVINVPVDGAQNHPASSPFFYQY